MLKKCKRKIFCYLLVIIMVFEQNAMYVTAEPEKNKKETVQEYENVQSDTLETGQIQETVTVQRTLTNEIK